MRSPYVVYFLVDPRDGSVFYVGCTSQWGKRQKGHYGEFLRGKGNARKRERMQQIYDAGLKVLMWKMRSFRTEAEALATEAQFISQIRGLTNRATKKSPRVDAARAPTHGALPSIAVMASAALALPY